MEKKREQKFLTCLCLYIYIQNKKKELISDEYYECAFIYIQVYKYKVG